ncbi:MAG: hypothetical protein ACREUT_00560 [Steroidobacteraceae bacterium]
MQKEYPMEGGASLTGAGRSALDADEIVAAALKRSGRRDFGDRSFLLPLRRLIAACNVEGNLSAFGRHAVRFDVLRGLKNVLELDAMEEEQPALRSRPLERPIFITGMPRSGTTFLHCWINGAERMLRAAAAAAPEPILHLSYRQIMAAPIEAARAVLSHAGLELSAKSATAMRDWLRSAPKNGSRPRRYDLAMFGLDPHALRAQFARYTERFGVELEWQGSCGSWV